MFTTEQESRHLHHAYWESSPASLVQAFEQSVRRHAQATAIVHGKKRTTFAELDAQANRIAHTLLALSPNNSAPAIVFFGHTSGQIAAILGVLKTGRAYSALDPTFPPERAALILDALQSTLIVTDTDNWEQAQRLADGRCGLMNVDAIATGTPESLPQLAIAPDDLAVVFFTSGSTGAPKGVMRTHANMLKLPQMRRAIWPCYTDDVVSMLYSCSFAASISDCYVALLSGATLCLYDLRCDGPSGLANWINGYGVTRLHLHAPVLRQLLDDLPASVSFPTLRFVRPSDRLHRSDVERLWRRLPASAQVAHSLASTETGVMTTLTLERDRLPEGDIVPVGRPLPNVDIRLLDESGQPVPPGEVGEMVVSAPALTPGYWRNPELTAAKFFVDSETGRRFYRLGDLARWRPDGLLELAGRRDFQVKIRGYRVELSEVEAVLEQSGAVRQALVVADAQPGEELRLIAYVAPATPEHFSLADLRRNLATRLPGYMLPAAFVVLDRLPLMTNGKVDRRALPPPSSARPVVSGAYVAPRTPLEQELAAIWADVLGLKQVGIHDNFLELGGHSLRAARIVSRVAAAYQVELSLAALFDAATVAEMALAITQQQVSRLDAEEIERLLAEVENAFP